MVAGFSPFFKDYDQWVGLEGILVRYSLPQYESDQLISLMGNKRALQESLRLVFSDLMPKKGTPVFLDPFCGSGAVSRVAKSLGFRVLAGDLEPFSFIVNHVYLSLDNADLLPLFAEMGGLDAYLSLLNLQGLYAASTDEDLPKGYLSRYYAPRNDHEYDGQKERLYYTRFNALFLDAVREEIEQGWLQGRISAVEKAIVLSCILYEASRRANTSGSFTAYLKQFGSYEKSAPSRITASSELHAPILAEEGSVRGTMYSEEASILVKRCVADICYLDPPSSIHQYGSAYHLLNSITLWDRYVPGVDTDSLGNLIDRGGIRPDWKQTHSPFCSLKHADAAMVHLIGSVDARNIVLTYPSSGIVSAQRIFELLSARHGPVRMVPLAKRNQGGRQPLSGKKKNVEQIFITGKVASLSITVGDSMQKLPYITRLQEMLSAVFYPREDCGLLHFNGGVLLEELPPASCLLAYSSSELANFVKDMEGSVCESLEDSLDLLLDALGEDSPYPLDGKGRARIEKRILSLLRRSCDSSHRELFDSLFMQVCAKVQGRSTFASLGRRLDALGEAADKRIGH
jgi:adenine-specific DNA-methyltransferase